VLRYDLIDKTYCIDGWKRMLKEKVLLFLISKIMLGLWGR